MGFGEWVTVFTVGLTIYAWYATYRRKPRTAVARRAAQRPMPAPATPRPAFSVALTYVIAAYSGYAVGRLHEIRKAWRDGWALGWSSATTPRSATPVAVAPSVAPVALDPALASYKAEAAADVPLMSRGLAEVEQKTPELGATGSVAPTATATDATATDATATATEVALVEVPEVERAQIVDLAQTLRSRRQIEQAVYGFTGGAAGRKVKAVLAQQPAGGTDVA